MEALKNGEVTPIMDRLIFRNVRKLLGGQVKMMMVGGAPLSPETHSYIKAVMGTPVLQGYGLTETTCCTSLMDPEDNSTGKCGPPCPGIQVCMLHKFCFFVCNAS